MATKKMKMIQMRPEPPQLGSVRSDLAEAPNGDVAFTFFKSNIEESKPNVPKEHRTTTSVQDADASRDLLKSSLAMELPSSPWSSPPAEVAASDFSRCYNRTLEFIQMNDYLRDSQEGLADQCAELQALGQSVKDQVELLRTQLS